MCVSVSKFVRMRQVVRMGFAIVHKKIVAREIIMFLYGVKSNS